MGNLQERTRSKTHDEKLKLRLKNSRIPTKSREKAMIRKCRENPDQLNPSVPQTTT